MKWMYPLRGLVAALVLFSFSPAEAADPVPVEAFVAQQTFKNPRISSAGSYVAFAVDLDEDEHAIMVFRLSDMQQTAYLKLPKYQLAAEIQWVSDETLIYVKGGKWGAREEPFSYGEINAMDYDGSHHNYMFNYRETPKGNGLLPGFGVYVGRPAKPDGSFYMTRLSEESAIGHTVVYKVDVKKFRYELLADVPGQNMAFAVDDDGVPRFAYGADENEHQLLYVAEDEDGKDWKKVGDEFEGTFRPFAFTPDGKHVFGWRALNNGPEALVKADLDLKNIEVLATDGFNSVEDVVFDSQHQPLAVEFKGALPKVQIINPASPDAKLYQELRAGFPGQNIRFADHSADGSISLIGVYSDRSPGEWALYNRKSGVLARLLQVNPGIDPNRMGTRHYIRFTASDGVELDGYATVPAGTTELKSLPMVVLPHGGPHGISDSWGFDTDAQFLASRGYLVLQVNYRGSADRGYAFRAAGYRHWADRIQDDLADGIGWALSHGYADPKRICVYGASFGAYSAMMMAANYPGLVACAAGESGLYDLRSMASDSDTARSYGGRADIRRMVGDDDAVLLANSPVGVVRKIKVPVLLAHGDEDKRTPFDQAEDMLEALRKAGNKPLWMPVENEGHGFYKRENRIAFYKKLEKFLADNIGSSAAN